MSITLSWWMIPVAGLVVGVVAWARDDGRGFFGRIAGMAVFAACVIAAMAFTAGHFS